MPSRKFFVLLFPVLWAVLASAQTRPKAPKSVRLYVFDNGVIKGIDPARFLFKKEELATTEMVVASYLIVHPKGTLMWDSGAIPDAELKADSSPVTKGSFTATKTLKSQLATNRLTCENGSQVPRKLGWATLVIPSLLNLPLSLAGLSWPASTIARSATAAVLVMVSLEPSHVRDQDLDRVGPGAGVGVGVCSGHDERGAGNARLADRPDRRRSAVAPVD